MVFWPRILTRTRSRTIRMAFEVNMSIRWFASLYSQNYQQWGKHQSHSGVPRFHPGHADTHALCTYVCVCVPVYMCMHGTMLACIHDHPWSSCMYACMHVCMYACMHVCMYVCMYCLYVCLSACLPVCLYILTPFCASYVCVCMHVSMYAGRYVGMYVCRNVGV